MPVISVPAPLRRQLGDEASDSLVEFVNAAGASTRDDVIEIVGERFERRLSEEMAKVNERITSEMAKVNERITSEMAKVNERITSEMAKVNERITTEISGLRVEMARMRSDLIRWMFAFWIGQTVVIATLFALLR